MTLRPAIALFLLLVAFFLVACAASHAAAPLAAAAKTIGRRNDSFRILLDFEEPNPDVAWNDLAQPAATAPATEPVPQTSSGIPALTRSSVQPHTGLWSLQVALDPHQQGEIIHRFAQPLDLQNEDSLLAGVMHLDDPARSGEATAALVLVDNAGKQYVGDAFRVTSRWQMIPLDLYSAAATVDLSRIASVALQLRHISGTQPLAIQTDTWRTDSDHQAYVGQRLGIDKSFYVQRFGSRLTAGIVGQYEITFFQRAGTERPWMTITQNGTGKPALVLGQPGTGLMLLDQDMIDALGTSLHQNASPAPLSPSTSAVPPPPAGWPPAPSAGPGSQWSWECTWASPVAAIVEVRQEVGPYDRLGQPAVALKWRFMIYQWGQVFVHVEWTPNAAVPAPISWALVLDRSVFQPASSAGPPDTSAAGAQRLLSALYPASVRDGLATALPHQMQTGAPIAMIAKTGALNGGKNNWWWASSGDKKLFGVGITLPPPTTPPSPVATASPAALDCMLLVNHPSALMQAGSFSQYLVPPKVRVRQGELDRNFPGDTDNDGLVEPYGFQVIRLANGRASFMIYPQDRPLFYPPYLFTVPAVERAADDVRDSRMLINIDGSQFADPPVFPDGSFLLQVPYVIDRPVQVEAVLVKK